MPDEDGALRGAPGRASISFTPALPDGQDCPWTRGRRTRWWLVPPADLVASGLAALFCSASAGPRGGALVALPAALWQPALGVVLGWVVAWAALRRRGDHLEMASPEGLVVTAVAWVTWSVLHVLGAGPALSWQHLSWVVRAGAFLLVFLEGWRCLYGYVRAHDSLVPEPLARRIATQGDDDGQGSGS